MAFVHRARKYNYDCLICDKHIEKLDLYVILNYPFASSSGYIFHIECYLDDHPDGVCLGYKKAKRIFGSYWKCKTITSIKQIEKLLEKNVHG